MLYVHRGDQSARNECPKTLSSYVYTYAKTKTKYCSYKPQVGFSLL